MDEHRSEIGKEEEEEEKAGLVRVNTN